MKLVTYRVPGGVLTEREHVVPLDHARPDGPKITIFSRELADPDGLDRPYLLFLQGGPGFEATRPILVNGIEELATRGDLLDRAVLLHLPAISEPHRRAEAGFWEDFRRAWPGLLGALLDALVGALAILPTLTLPGLPRMADFARFGVAVERALAWPPGSFLATYGANREAAHELTLQASLVAASEVSPRRPATDRSLACRCRRRGCSCRGVFY